MRLFFALVRFCGLGVTCVLFGAKKSRFSCAVFLFAVFVVGSDMCQLLSGTRAVLALRCTQFEMQTLLHFPIVAWVSGRRHRSHGRARDGSALRFAALTRSWCILVGADSKCWKLRTRGCGLVPQGKA